MVLRMRLVSPCACASETDGRSSEDMDDVRALGNIISGNAIPENTPYTERAAEELRPLAISFLGNCIVSTLDIRLMQILFRLIGSAKDRMEMPFLYEMDLWMETFLLPGRSASIKHEKKAEENSPTSMPIQI